MGIRKIQTPTPDLVVAALRLKGSMTVADLALVVKDQCSASSLAACLSRMVRAVPAILNVDKTGSAKVNGAYCRVFIYSLANDPASQSTNPFEWRTYRDPYRKPLSEFTNS